MSTNIGLRPSPCTTSRHAPPIAAALCAGLLAGCGGVDWAPPVQPTVRQERAIDALRDAGTRVALATRGKTETAKLLDVYRLVGGLSDTAVLDGRVPLTLPPLALDQPTCVRRVPRGGLVFDDCTIAGAAMKGHVQVTETAVAFDLHLPSAACAAGVGVGLTGTLSFARGLLEGELVFASEGESTYDPATGATSSHDPVGVKTTVEWGVSMEDTAAAITDGYIEVRVQAQGGEHDARFLFWNGADVKVENNRD